MTKVQAHFVLQKPLDDILERRIADAHSIYGLMRIQPTSALDELVVDFDATRLRLSEVEAALERAGIAVKLKSA